MLISDSLGPRLSEISDSPGDLGQYLLCSFCQLIFSSKITIFISNCVSKIFIYFFEKLNFLNFCIFSFGVKLEWLYLPAVFSCFSYS